MGGGRGGLRIRRDHPPPTECEGRACVPLHEEDEEVLQVYSDEAEQNTQSTCCTFLQIRPEIHHVA